MSQRHAGPDVLPWLCGGLAFRNAGSFGTGRSQHSPPCTWCWCDTQESAPGSRAVSSELCPRVSTPAPRGPLSRLSDVVAGKVQLLLLLGNLQLSQRRLLERLPPTARARGPASETVKQAGAFLGPAPLPVSVLTPAPHRPGCCGFAVSLGIGARGPRSFALTLLLFF